MLKYLEVVVMFKTEDFIKGPLVGGLEEFDSL